jgi:uncharacterized protein (DUF1499 family)
MNRTRTIGWTALLPLLMTACAGNPPPTLGPVNGGLAPCPDTPNCFHVGEEPHADQPAWMLAPTWASQAQTEASSVMDAIQEEVERLPRTRVLRREALPDGNHYLHATSTSRFFRFVDDLELLLKPEDGLILVRSASRLGHSDLGVNAKRIASLRQSLEDKGMLNP